MHLTSTPFRLVSLSLLTPVSIHLLSITTGGTAMRAQWSRRDFLRVTGGAAGVALLAACAPTAPANAPAVEGSGKKYEGQTLTVAGMAWMWDSTKPLYEQFLDETGIKLEVAAFGQ